MSYRPITDVWILARSKVKYFGAYPGGFLQRARDLLGCTMNDQVLHVCSGCVREYPYKGIGPNDVTLDMSLNIPATYHLDAGVESTYRTIASENPQIQGALADPPYSPEFAKEYEPGPEFFPTADKIVRYSMHCIPVGGRVGVLSLGWPRYPKKVARQVAIIGVVIGNGNLGRWFAVYERTA